MKVDKRLRLLAAEKGYSTPRDFLISELNSGKTICQISGELGVQRKNLATWADRNKVPRRYAVSIDQRIKELGYDSECEYFLKNWYKSFSSMADELDSTFLAIKAKYNKFRKEMAELEKEIPEGPFFHGKVG